MCVLHLKDRAALHGSHSAHFLFLGGSQPKSNFLSEVKGMIPIAQMSARLANECYINIGNETGSPAIFGGSNLV